jgi:hypothetical protein
MYRIPHQDAARIIAYPAIYRNDKHPVVPDVVPSPSAQRGGDWGGKSWGIGGVGVLTI